MEDKEFSKCPACGAESPYFQMIAEELKEAGRVPDGWNFYLDKKQGIVFPPDRLAVLPIGAEVPGFQFMTDICSECGCIYCVKLVSTVAKKSIQPVQVVPPNRAERRRIERECYTPPNFGNIGEN